MVTAPHVVILGSGVAGLVAGHELAERGLAVTVIEAASIRGGRTSSWRDARGRDLDTGLHVVADHYVNLIEVLGRLGATRHLRWFTKHLYLHAERKPLTWHFSPWQPPFHLIRPFFAVPTPLAARIGMSIAGLRISMRSQADLAELDEIPYIEWHRRHRMGDGFLLDLAEAASDAASFLGIEEAAARPVLSWMKYLMRNQRAGDVGLFTGSLDDCLVRPLRDSIERRGGRIRTGLAAVELEREGQRVTAVHVAPSAVTGPLHSASGDVPLQVGAPRERIACDAVVSALSVQGFQRLFGRDLARDAGVLPAFALTTTPAMSLLVWFDRQIEPAPPGAPLVSGSAMRDLLDLAVVGRAPAGALGSVYQFVITHARQRWDRDDEAIVAEVVRDLARVWPASQTAHVVDHALERIEAAMFAAVPGAHRLRPTARTHLPNLFLAGDWTRHESNASMEGAAVSARLAADALLRSLGQPGVAVRTPPDPIGIEMLVRARQRIKGAQQRLQARRHRPTVRA
jgi:15-cis-phytoene desaturase